MRAFSASDGSSERLCLSDVVQAAEQDASSLCSLKKKLDVRFRRERRGVTVDDLVVSAQYKEETSRLHIATAETAVMLLECSVADSHDRSRRKAAAFVITQLRILAGLVSLGWL